MNGIIFPTISIEVRSHKYNTDLCKRYQFLYSCFISTYYTIPSLIHPVLFTRPYQDFKVVIEISREISFERRCTLTMIKAKTILKDKISVIDIGKVHIVSTGYSIYVCIVAQIGVFKCRIVFSGTLPKFNIKVFFLIRKWYV